MMLSEFASLEFIIDDSGSMMCHSDTVDPVTKRANTRWAEAHQRLKEMLEILGAYRMTLCICSSLQQDDVSHSLQHHPIRQPTSPFNKLELNF